MSGYDCLICDGLGYDTEHKACPNRLMDDKGLCAWYRIVDSDLEKLKQGRHDLTFSDLEALIKDEVAK